MPLKTHSSKIAFDRYDDVVYLPFIANSLAQGQGVYDDLYEECSGMAEAYKLDNVMTAESQSLANIDPAAQIYVWAHGNAARQIAATIGGTKVAKDIVDSLYKDTLPLTFSGVVVLWSCLGGSLGGMAESLFLEFRRRGYQNLEVYGSKYVTGSMVRFDGTIIDDSLRYRGFEVLNPNSGMGGALAPEASGTRTSPSRWHGPRVLATVDDMRRIGGASLRSAEAPARLRF